MRAWVHTSVAVADLDAAEAFFAAALGFRRLFRVDGMADRIASIAGTPGLVCDLLQMDRGPAGGPVLELVAFRAPGGTPAADARPFRPGAGHLAFTVDDLAAARAACEALGAVAIGQETDFEEGPALYLRVPGGAFVEIEEERGR